MNILVLSLRGPTDCAFKGGASEFLAHVGAIWSGRGHRTRILCCQEGRRLPRAEEVNGVEVLRAGTRATATTSIARRYTAHRRWADVVVENLLEIPLLTPAYVRRPLLVLAHHLMDREWFSVKPAVPAAIGYVEERLVLPLVYGKARFAAVSTNTQQDLARLGIRDVRVVSPGVEHHLYQPGGSKSPHPTFLFVGRLDDRRKRVQDLFPVLERVQQKHPDAELLIAGAGQCLERLRAMAAGKKVRVLGFVDDATKVALYRESWAHIIPSSREGFGLTAVEASACGTPVIAYDAPGLASVEHNVNGLKVPVGDVDALAERLCAFLCDPGLRLRLGQQAIQFSQQWTWERTALGLLDRAVNERTPLAEVAS